MATPLTAAQLVGAFTREGCNPQGYRDWANHERDAATGKTFGPVNGIVIHHTAGRDSLSLVYNGTSSLPGPLCHVHLAKNGTFSLISAGRANHAGSFAQNAHDAVVNESAAHPYPDSAEPVDGNDHYYGIEIENLGDGADVYPWVQYVQAVRFAAALCRAHGWTANSVIGHKEGTRRKVDPKGPVEREGMFNMNNFRDDVTQALALPAGAWAKEEEDMALTADDVKKLYKTDDVLKAGAPTPTNLYWTAESYFYETYKVAKASSDNAAVARLAVAELAAKVDALSTGGVDLDALAVKVADEIYKRMAG